MDRQASTQITLSKTALFLSLALALLVGGGVVFFVLTGKQSDPVVSQVAPTPTIIPAPIKPKPAPAVKKTAPKKLAPTQAKIIKSDGRFVIEGLLATGGEPWTAKMIIIKILWLKNQNGKQFLLGQEASVVQATANGFAYRITLKPQARKFLNWNAGVEGNVGRVIAFLDHKRDARLSMGKDKIIAVSKELIRYRTGRYDKSTLNEIQQQNIQQAGKGYVVVRNMPVGENKTDWKVVANKSPARVDLNATETSLPNMYNTFMKLQ